MPTLTRTITGDTAVAVALTALTRTDNGQTPDGVTLPAAFTSDGGGVWTFAFADAAPALRYAYGFTVTWADGSTDSGSGTAIGVVTVTGFWTAQLAVESRYGRFNVDADAELQNDGTGAAAAWAAVIGETDADFDRACRVRGYSRPDPAVSRDYAVASELARDWARVKLYVARGWTDGGDAKTVAGRFQRLADSIWRLDPVSGVETGRLVTLLDGGVDFPRGIVAPGACGVRPAAYVPPNTFTSVPASFDRPHFPRLPGWSGRW